MSPSQSVLGVHAGSLEDCWRTAFHISSTVGGDPGHPGLYGEATLDASRKPKRLVRLDTRGWAETEEETREIFERFVTDLRGQGVDIVSREDDERIEALECGLETIPDFMFDIFAYEMRWPTWGYRDKGEGYLSDAILERLSRGEEISPGDYRSRLDMRAELRRVFAQLEGSCDGYVTLSAKGPPPVGMPVGDPIYGDVSSCLGSPAWNLPLHVDRGLPMGIQLLGHPHQDHALALTGKWFAEAFLNT